MKKILIGYLQIWQIFNKIFSDIKDYFNEFNEKIANWVPLTTIIGNDCISLKKLISGFFFDIFSKNIQKVIYYLCFIKNNN